jgi:hypothetical protein
MPFIKPNGVRLKKGLPKTASVVVLCVIIPLAK